MDPKTPGVAAQRQTSVKLKLRRQPIYNPRAQRVPERSWLDHVPEVVSRDADTYRQFVVTLSRGFVRGVQQLPARRRELHDAIEKLEAGFLDLPQVERLMERNPV